MRTWTWAPAVLLLLALNGCESLPWKPVPPPRTVPPGAAKECTSVANCAVTVTVDCPASGCVIKVDAEIIATNGHPVRWTIQSASAYSFDRSDGIRFKTPEGRAAFACHRLGNGDFQCTGNRNGNAYPYAIHLQGSPPVPVLDPWVVNN
ncbi:MAG: hypothetical protein ABI920_12005 [Casimicrobiaceae bacterium]